MHQPEPETEFAAALRAAVDRRGPTWEHARTAAATGSDWSGQSLAAPKPSSKKSLTQR